VAQATPVNGLAVDTLSSGPGINSACRGQLKVAA
jgi:hypothetical protein